MNVPVVFGHNVVGATNGSYGDYPLPGGGDHFGSARGDLTARALTTGHRPAAARRWVHRSTAAVGPVRRGERVGSEKVHGAQYQLFGDAVWRYV
jgi:hypothetical protein